VTDQTEAPVNGHDGAIGFSALDRLDFNKGEGLIPAVIQHAGTGVVLMIGYMNRKALEATLTRGRVVFFSRSKGRLWEKGETSGHSLEVVEIHADCDRDALLVAAWPRGPVCHLGHANCFGSEPSAGAQPLAFLGELEHVIGERMAQRLPGSYTARLVASGMKRIAQKVSEEGLEVALAAAAGTDGEVVAEASDLFYHVLVLLKARGLSLRRVVAELEERHQRKREGS
jgi:phosphoribosyl-AMP cyclohydrolase / phosphoribosyl-ATP pyrophosphohydrolase